MRILLALTLIILAIFLLAPALYVFTFLFTRVAACAFLTILAIYLISTRDGHSHGSD